MLREPDGTLVFVEVRARRGCDHGGAAASVTAAKQPAHRLGRAALPAATGQRLPPCRLTSWPWTARR
jgi:putative endonuclease